MNSFKCSCGQEIQMTMYGDPSFIADLQEENARLKDMINALTAMYLEKDDD